MEEETKNNSDNDKLPESPKPLAFTIDFNDGKVIDTERHKTLLEKCQRRHRRGQSLSKLEDKEMASVIKKHPLTGNLPRKSSFQSEGYFSSDEKIERTKNVRLLVNNFKSRDNLSLPLRNVTTEKMTQSFQHYNLPSITSPEIELKNISSPELELVSPYSPVASTRSNTQSKIKVTRQYSSPECETKNVEEQFCDGNEFDFDKSDTVSDAGTYTLDAENYSEEQKARMSIDSEFKIEKMSLQQKTEDYIKSLQDIIDVEEETSVEVQGVSIQVQDVNINRVVNHGSYYLQSPMQEYHKTIITTPKTQKLSSYEQKTKMLSPILSPTQNISITDNVQEESKGKMNNAIESDILNKTFSKILFPSPKAKNGNGLEQCLDQGNIISVTSSGAFRPKSEIRKMYKKQVNLTKTEVQVEAYNPEHVHATFTINRPSSAKLTATIVHVGESIPNKNNELNNTDLHNTSMSKVINLPPSIGGVSGKLSPTKIPSPVHTINRPRSGNSVSSLHVDLSDNCFDTESYLKPTQNYITTLQQKLSLDSDNEIEYETQLLNNDARNLIKQKPTHARHNSFDDRSLKSNKLEHFQNKNLLIDQTYTNVLNQYHHNKVHKIQNSPNNSPVRRSSSFSTKNQINVQTKCSNLQNSNLINKESNIKGSPNLTNRNSSTIQRSASTANIKPNLLQNRRSSTSSDHTKIDRNLFADTESSSEEDFDKNQQKKKDITNTRYNRAFSLRRARLDTEPTPQPKCPNTPEMRRKFQPNERAVSVDRKTTKQDVQSRYLLNICKNRNTPSPKLENIKKVPKMNTHSVLNKPQIFSRTDSGRFSTRTKPPVAMPNLQKKSKKDVSGTVKLQLPILFTREICFFVFFLGKKQSGPRSNSSLSSREVEFQNWKRRKSYDPMKAAAEGKKKAELAKKQNQNPMTQSLTEANQDYDSSPSHSSSVHRSQVIFMMSTPLYSFVNETLINFIFVYIFL